MSKEEKLLFISSILLKFCSERSCENCYMNFCAERCGVNEFIDDIKKYIEEE